MIIICSCIVMVEFWYGEYSFMSIWKCIVFLSQVVVRMNNIVNSLNPSRSSSSSLLYELWSDYSLITVYSCIDAYGCSQKHEWKWKCLYHDYLRQERAWNLIKCSKSLIPFEDHFFLILEFEFLKEAFGSMLLGHPQWIN